MHYSYSKIRRFRDCPLAFRFEYLDKVEVEEFETIEAFMGSRVHEVLDRFYGEILKGKAPELGDVQGLYYALWDKRISPAVVVNKQGLSLEDYRSAGARCLREYYDSYKPFDNEKTVATELLVRIDLLGDGSYKFIGFIDRLDRIDDGVYEIHDYKTSQSLPSQKKKDADEQLALYELGIRQGMSEVSGVDLVWHYLRHNKEMRSRRTHQDLEVLKGSLLSTVRKIEEAIVDDHFPAARTNLCAWCAYQEICKGTEKRKEYRQTSLGLYTQNFQ